MMQIKNYESTESIYIKIEELVECGMKINQAIKKLGYDVDIVNRRLSSVQLADLQAVRENYLAKRK